MSTQDCHADCCLAPECSASDHPQDCVEYDDDEQAALIRHNAEFDAWEAMTDKQREDAIQWAAKNPC